MKNEEIVNNLSMALAGVLNTLAETLNENEVNSFAKKVGSQTTIGGDSMLSKLAVSEFYSTETREQMTRNGDFDVEEYFSNLEPDEIRDLIVTLVNSL